MSKENVRFRERLKDTKAIVVRMDAFAINLTEAHRKLVSF